MISKCECIMAAVALTVSAPLCWCADLQTVAESPSAVVGNVRVTCKRPEGWRFSLATKERQPGLEVLTLVAESSAVGTVPPFAVRFSVPRKDLHHMWHPAEAHFPCCWTSQKSSFSVNLPLRANFDDSERNVLTFGVSDALHAIDFGTAIGFADGNAHVIDFTASFFGEASAPTRRYETQIRLDARKVFWAEAVTDGSRWISEASGRRPSVPPPDAFEPLYSSWYVFRQGITQARMDTEIERAAALGMKTVILDDGWQCERGDWKMDTEKFPDLRAQVEKAHRLGMKYLLWLSLPHVTTNSPAFGRFQGKFLRDRPNHWGIHVLDPRYPEVRDHLVGRLRDLLVEYGLDGFKLDFIDEFVAAKDDPAARKRFAGCDIKGVPEATERLLRDIHAALLGVRPDVMVEFRQLYVGPVVRQYGNILRAADCPGDFAANRFRTLALRILAPESAVHSDMLLWRSDDTVAELKRQVWNSMFATVQYSAWLEGLPPDHLAAVRETIDFLKKHRETLQKGTLKPHRPELGYPWVEAEGARERIVAVYDPDCVIPVPAAGRPTIVVNATSATSLVVDVGGKLSRVAVEPSGVKEL